jgi:hypothetical protein
MKRECLIIGLLLLAGCQQEVIVHESTIARQFSEMNKEGWQVTRNDQPKAAGTAADPNVRVIREADFSGMRFNTNFQVDDPRLRQPATRPNQPPATAPALPPPTLVPFGAPVVTPGN